MVTPLDEKQLVALYATDKHSKNFAKVYIEKFGKRLAPELIYNRIHNLWYQRFKCTALVNALKAKEEAKNHTVMIPARIVSKHSPSRDAVPDIGETLVRTNHLLAELVQLQKEQFALFKEMKEVKK